MKKIVLTIMVMLMGLTSVSAASITAVGKYEEGTSGSHKLTTNEPSVTRSSVESFLDMSGLDGVEGSAFKDSFQITMGQVFSFDWTFSTTENVNAPAPYFHNDYSFINFKLGDETIFEILGQAENGNSAGIFKWTATESGLLSYGIGILDVASSSSELPLLSKATDSSIVISNINPVPLPAAVWLFISGLFGLVGVRRRVIR